jgi:hypothetical protein
VATLQSIGIRIAFFISAFSSTVRKVRFVLSHLDEITVRSGRTLSVTDGLSGVGSPPMLTMSHVFAATPVSAPVTVRTFERCEGLLHDGIGATYRPISSG